MTDHLSRPPQSAEELEAWFEHLWRQARRALGPEPAPICWVLARSLIETLWGQSIGDGTCNPLGIEAAGSESAKRVVRPKWDGRSERFVDERRCLRIFASDAACFEAWATSVGLDRASADGSMGGSIARVKELERASRISPNTCLDEIERLAGRIWERIAVSSPQ